MEAMDTTVSSHPRRMYNSYEDEEERKHFQRIVSAFRYYKTHSLQRVRKTESYFLSLPQHHQKLLSKYRGHLQEVKRCIENNDQIIKLIIKDVAHIFENVCPTTSQVDNTVNLRPVMSDQEKVQATIKQLVRDWSVQGAEERKACYQPIVDEILHQFPSEHWYDNPELLRKQLILMYQENEESKNKGNLQNILDFKLLFHWRPKPIDWTKKPKLNLQLKVFKMLRKLLFTPSDVHILVPGAGLGRLAFEIAKRGYTCQGNEFSLFMLFASNFVLNKCRAINLYQVHPWVHQYMNNLKPEHQTQAVSFPDVSPSDLPGTAQFSMTAGDFLEVYTESNHWDCVATCFFIDCANNVVQFIETIYKILKPGGVWINLGPLLYHFSDLPNEESIEPSYDAIRDVILGFGFQLAKEQTKVKTRYAQNINSMLQCEYNSVYFVCRKPNEYADGVNHNQNGGETDSAQEQEN